MVLKILLYIPLVCIFFKNFTYHKYVKRIDNSLINKITIKENKPGSEPNQNKPAGKK